jgi:YD repeat-containing protein
MVDRGWMNRACLRVAHVLAAGLIVACATDAHAGSGDASCFGLYSQSHAVPGTRGCAISVAGGTPGGMGNYSCINRLDLIDSYCATPSTPPPEASCPVADPVYPATGVTTVSETDFVSGGDLPLVFKRTYRSAPFTRTDSGFGTNWFHNWQRQLDVAKASGASAQVIAYRDDGSKLAFVKDAGQWKASGGMPFTLAQSASDWTITDLTNDTRETYSAAGVLNTVSTHERHVISLTYSDANTPAVVAPAPGLLISVTEHAEDSVPYYDLVLRFAYDAKSRITQLTDPAGAVTRYGYDQHDNLVSVTWPDRYVRRFAYENAAFWTLLTGVIDETGSRIATWNYDAKGRAISVSHPDTTRNVQFAYGDGTTTVTDSRRTTTLSFAPVGGVARPIGSSSSAGSTSSTWDASGNLLTDRAVDGSDVEFAYDMAGRPVRSVRRSGAGVQITSMRYADGSSLRPWMAAMPGKIRAFVYDAAGNPTGVSELTTDDPTGARGFDASTASGQKRTYGMTYDSFNHLKTLQVYTNGVLSEYWHLTTDGSGNSRSWEEGVSGRTVGIFLRDAAHRPLNLSAPGVDVTVSYDVRGRVSKFWYTELATRENSYVQRRLTVSYGYSPDGRVASRTGSVKTDSGAEVAISSGEIDYWLDNYEAGVMPAGPAGGAVSLLLKGLMALPEPGLEPVCVECWISQGIRWAAGAVSWGMSIVRNNSGQCKNAGTPSENGISFQTGHYAPRLREDGLNVSAVEARVAEEVEKLRAQMIPNKSEIRRITIDGVVVEFRAFMRPDGQINVGTIFPVH